MKKNVSVILCGLVLALLMAPPTSADVLKLRHSQGQAEMPFILALNNGDLLVVFSEGHSFNADADALYMIYSKEKKTWSAPKIAFKKSFSAAFLQLALDSVGNVHAAMMDGNASANRDIYYTWYDVEKDKWANKVLAYQSPGANSSWPRIKIEDDLIYILWTHNYDPSVGQTDVTMITNPVGGTWPVAKDKRITVSDTGQSASVHVFFDVRDKNVYAAWIDDNHRPGNWNIYYTEGTYNEAADTWNFPRGKALWPSTINQYYPALTLDDSGNVHIIFSHKTGPFVYAQKKGANWSGTKIISTRGCTFNLLAFMKYSHGLIHTVWRQTANNGEGLYYGRALPDGTWAEPVEVATGQIFPGYPGLDVDADGNVHIVWSDGDPDHPRHIYYSEVELPGEAPEAVISANKVTGLIPLTVQFNGTKSWDPGGGKIVEYRWDFGDGTSAAGQRVSHTFTQKGLYGVSLTVIDDDFRTGVDRVEILASSGEPLASFTTSATQGMIPLTVNFDAAESQDTDGEIVSYNWEFGDGTGDTGVQVTHIYEGGGEFNATLKVIDNDGKTGSASTLITVYQKPEAFFTADPLMGKAPLEVSFNASASFDADGNIRSYKWDFGDGMTDLSKKVTHTFSTPGTFNVVLTVTDDDGFTGTTMEAIKVLDAPLPPVDIKVERMSNRSFLHTEYLNIITWQANPANSGLFTIAKYRVYRKAQTANASQYALVGEVQGGSNTYQDRGFSNGDDAANYVYTVTSVDDQGKESGLPAPGAVQAGSVLRDVVRDSSVRSIKK